VRRLSLVLRGLWWRKGLTGAVLGVAVVTTTAAALGPLYARAAAESVLQDHLTQAGSGTGLHLQGNLDIGSPGAYAFAVKQVPKPGVIKGYPSLIEGLYTPSGLSATLTPEGAGRVNTHLVWRTGACGHLVIVSGHCPNAPNEAIISQRTVDAGVYNWRVGTTLYLGVITITGNYYTGPLHPATPPPIKVVGTYRPRDTADPFWFGQDYFDARGSAQGVDTVDSLFVDQSEFLDRKSTSLVEADFDYPLTPSAVRLNTVPAERAAVQQVLNAHARNQPYSAQTGLFAVLDAAAHEHHLVNIGTLLVTLQLALLAWLVLFQVVSDAIEARGNEIAMAKLRGHSPGATIRFGLGEPLVLLAAAVPLGLLLGLGVTHLFADSVLVAGVPVQLTASAVLTALVAFGGGLIAAALAGQRTLTRSVLDQWRRTNRQPGHGRLAVVVDVLLAAAAITGLVLLREHHQAGTSNDSAALLAPGLLVFAVAIIGVRLLPLACRWLARITRASRRLGLFLAARQVSRRPVGLRLAALLAVAVGLATFAVAGESVASTNRTHRAQAELGADRVATVQFDNRLNPVVATHQADPTGSWAMAAANWLPDGGDSIAGTLLAVDSSRLAVVGRSASGGPTTAELAHDIGAAAVPAITITAPQMRIRLTASDLTGDARPSAQLNFATPTQPYLNVESGKINDGANTFVVPVACARGCTLRGLTWDRPFNSQGPLGGTITLTGLDIGDGTNWRPLNLALTTPTAWRAAVPQGQSTDRVLVTATGVRDRFNSTNGGYGGIVYAYAPSPIPAVATAKAIVNGAGAPKQPQILDATSTVAFFTVVQRVSVLPFVLDDGAIMNVQFLMNELPAFTSEANWQVWIGPKAPADALARLRAAGFEIQNVHSESARVTVLGRQAPALALLLLLVCAVAGAVLAVGGTAISISASSRRRSYEIAALRAVGVSRRALLRASIAEQLLLLGTAVVLGVPTGLLAARLAMPVIPEFADSTPITLLYTPRVLPTVIFAGAFVVLLTLTAFIAARALMRIAIPGRLREVEG
jgi:putative ABC transport system permease protein